MHPIGIVFESFIPSFLRKAKPQTVLEKYINKTEFDEISNNLHNLTKDQTKALNSIKAKASGEILLSGITSSGKTEVYKHFIKDLINKGKSALVLVPEIFLTPQIFNSFQKTFGNKVLLNHSGLTAIQRIKVWLASKNKGPKIIIGTNNKGKLREIKGLLPKSIKIFSTSDFNLKSPAENGLTFKENSIIKSKYFSKKSNLVCIADDSGLEIDCLDKKPGIFSARWAGSKGDFNKAIKRVYKELDKKDKNWKAKRIKARFVCALSICCLLYTSPSPRD